MMKPTMAIAVTLTATPALAHPGEHGGMDFAALAAHFFEPDHIIFATLAGIVGVLAYRAGRRAEAKAQAVKAQEVSRDSR